MVMGITGWTQAPVTSMWHLPLDPSQLVVRMACDSLEVMVPTIQPMTAWNRPNSLRPSLDPFSGLKVLGEAKQITGDFNAPATAIGLGTSGALFQRAFYQVQLTTWRLPLGFPLAQEVGAHRSMDGLGIASLLSTSVASVERLEASLSWALSPSVALRVGQESHHWGPGARSLFLDRHMAPAAGARLWIDAGPVQYTHLLLRTRHFNATSDSAEIGWMAAHWAEVQLGGGWTGAVFGAVKWRANDVAFQGRVEPHYIVPLAAFRPREYSIGSTDNALIGAQCTWRKRRRRGQWFTGYGQVLFDELLVSKLFAGNQWWGNKWGVLVGAHSTSRSGKWGWLVEGAAVRPWTYTHQSLPLSYTHLHQPLGHPAGGNFMEGRARLRAVVRQDWVVRLSALRRVQGRSLGGGESLLSFAAGEMPWTSFSERESDDGHPWLQGANTLVHRLELDVAYPLGDRYGAAGLEAFVRAWTRLEAQASPGAWQEPWDAGRLEIGIRQSRVMEERDW